MVFSSTVFLFLFLPALLIAYYYVKSRSNRNLILLLSSLLFYAWGEPLFILVMLGSVVVNYFLALKIHESKIFMIIAVIFDVSLLGIFKYTSFIVQNLTGKILNIPLPIGISFFTFQMMSYIFDVYYKKAEAKKNLLDVALYISFFPQLIAGPIVRYGEIEAEILNRHENFKDFSKGAERFIYGLAKKVLLANFLARIADNVFDYVPNPSAALSWLGAISYTMQIYFDFSGYSDMAIGLGLMFGFHFQENFNYPYIAKNIREFWHRWHISLSQWFRDYVYIPLGGSRVKASRQILNIFVVWLLTGIWHGANWTFILWGLIYFAFLIFERYFNKINSHVYTMLIIILAWVIFRSNSVSAGFKFIASMFGLNNNDLFGVDFMEYIKNTYVILIFALIGIFPVIQKFKELTKKFNCEWLEQIYLILIFSVSVLEIVGSSYNPFIYFNF